MSGWQVDIAENRGSIDKDSDWLILTDYLCFLRPNKILGIFTQFPIYILSLILSLSFNLFPISFHFARVHLCFLTTGANSKAKFGRHLVLDWINYGN